MAALNGQQTDTQLLASVSAILFNRGASSTSTYPTTAMILEILNTKYKELVGGKKWSWSTCEGTIATVNGTTRIVVPDSANWVMDFNIRGISQNIPVMPRQLFLSKYPSGWTLTGNGIPQIAVEAIPAANNAKQYDLWPTPNAVYTINYDGFLHVTPLTNSGAYTIIPPEFDRYLVYATAAEGLDMLGDPRADKFEQRAIAIRNKMWMADEDMISTQNTMRGSEGVATTVNIFPYLG